MSGLACIHGDYKSRCAACAEAQREEAKDAGDRSVLPVPAWARAAERDNAAAELRLGCDRLEAMAARCKVGIERTRAMFPASFDEARLPVTTSDAEFLALFAAAVREHLQGAS